MSRPSTGTVTIRRMRSYRDCLRAYHVRIDGIVVASVKASGSVTVAVTPGRHSIDLKIDWCGSNGVVFDGQAGEDVTFECGSNLTGGRRFLAIFYLILWPKEYLWLRRET